MNDVSEIKISRRGLLKASAAPAPFCSTGAASMPARLHPMQAAFVKHDGDQCGCCTPGQICSAVAMLDEIKRGVPAAIANAVYDATGVRVRDYPITLDKLLDHLPKLA